MQLAQMMGWMDDPFLAVSRWWGRQGADALPYENPRQVVNALHNSATEASAVARMRKMHYGAFYGKESRGPFSWLAERELLKKGPGRFGWRAGLIQGRPMMGISAGLGHLKGFVPFTALSAAVGGFTAPRGHKVSGVVGGIAETAGFFAGDVIGTALGGPLLGQLFGMAGAAVGSEIGGGIQFIHDYAKSIKHINMGGNYEDTRIAYTMRQRAAQEMGSSVMNARQWLGKEAAYMHQ